MTSSFLQGPYVAYDLEVAQQLKNRTAASLLNKLLYWFEKYQDGFYKFMEPCNHKLYRQGDSWTEEMGMARRTFTRAFDLIGVRYKSKALFQAQEDPFQGKLFASYVDNDTNQTFYLKNPQALDLLKLKKEKDSKEKAASKQEEEKLVEKNVRRATDKMTDPYKDNKKDFNKLIPPKSPLKGRGKGKRVKNNFSQKKVSSQSSTLSDKIKPMIEIFKQETNGRVPVPSVTSHFAQKLREAMEKFFHNSLEKWRLFCRKCASSKFLMGEGPSGFKAWLVWLIKEQVIEKIRQNQYGVSETISLQTRQEEEQDRYRFEEKRHALNRPVENPYQAMWGALTPLLKQQVDEVCYRTWLKPLSPVRVTATEIVLSAPSEMIRRHLQENYQSCLRDLFSSHLGRDVEVKIQVCPGLRQQVGLVREAR